MASKRAKTGRRWKCSKAGWRSSDGAGGDGARHPGDRRPVPPAPVNRTLAVLTALSKAYLSHVGQPNYNPAFDLNHNGQIGQDDAKLLLRSLPPLSPKIPLKLYVALAPQDQVARAHHPAELGRASRTARTPTILGHTTPGRSSSPAPARST